MLKWIKTASNPNFEKMGVFMIGKLYVDPDIRGVDTSVSINADSGVPNIETGSIENA